MRRAVHCKVTLPWDDRGSRRPRRDWPEAEYERIERSAIQVVEWQDGKPQGMSWRS
jgi:hypothetical protein